MSSRVKVGLLSHYFTDDNLGCVALSICNIMLIDEAAARAKIDIQYIVYVNEKQPHWQLDFTSTPYEYRVFSSSKQSLRHPVRLLKTSIFDDCDIVFNLCAGDGFTDIYGAGRVFSETYMTILAKQKGARVVLAPQTIGPFNMAFSKPIARYALSCCSDVFCRDKASAQYCSDLGYEGELREVIDVAFALPFERWYPGGSATNIGLNVSGLLFEGGYDHKNYFGLSFDYRRFIERLIQELQGLGYCVHLIAHVVTKDESIEDDYVACRKLKEKFPSTVLMPRKESPIAVKSYISGMDAFIGARMHSTIAAFSSGVPVIPIAYSRKFNGLFDTLEYPYYVDARSNISLDGAVERVVDYVARCDELKGRILQSQQIYRSGLDDYVSAVKNILIGTVDA